MKKEGDKRIKESIRYSNIEGGFAHAMLGFSDSYITPYALAMNATNRQIGMLSALPNLFASLVQLKSADVVDRVKSRKRIITISVLLQALIWIPIILIPFLFKTGISRVYALIIFIGLYAALGSFGGPAYGSLVSSLVKDNERGKFFGYRAKIFGFILIISMFAAGYILNLFSGRSLMGFTIIFSAAMIFRFLSLYFLKKMHDPKINFSKGGYFSFVVFYRRLKQSNFAKFTLYLSLMTFATNLVAPFFAVYIIKDLHFSYLSYTVLAVSAAIASLITVQSWGGRSDSLGRVRVLKLTSILVAIVPFLFLISKNVYWLISVQLFSGAVWAGFNLSASNFIYDSSIPEKRARCIAYFNVSNGIALFFGAILGGFLIRYLPLLFGYKILTLFLISGILRGAVSWIMLPRIKEVRKVEGVIKHEFHYINMVKNVEGAFKEFFRFRKR